ncbi:PAS domain-containing protein [Chloroflexia bacterium SDU3-3]|nr:PAS domain-containing protein [Chloroflexia bacterium SDU3-3]
MTDTTPADPNEDGTALHQRIAELEQQLSDAQQRLQIFQETIDSLPLLLYTTDRNEQIQIVNQPFAAWAQHSIGDLVGKKLDAIFPAALVGQWRADSQKVYQSNASTTSEQQIDSQGQVRSFRIQRTPLHGSDQQIYATTGTIFDITAQRQAEQALEQSQRILDGILKHAPTVIYVKDPSSKMLAVSSMYAHVLGRPVHEIVGKTEDQLFPAEVVRQWREKDRAIFAQRQPVQLDNVFEVDGEPRDFFSVQFPLYTADDQPYAICGISTDITSIRQAEREREQMQQTVIEAQQSALRDLSTPLIPIADGVVVMPLVGTMDSARAQQVMETLLEGVMRHQARTAIIDITGLPIVDTQVAAVLFQSARAVGLLGSEVVLTGIGPEVAQTLIGIGADLSSISTPGTLENGIAYALRKL